MFTNIFVLICLSFCMNYCLGNVINDENVDQSNDKKQQELIIQFENKMKTLFSIWKTETNLKLDMLEQMIPDLEENFNRKLNAMGDRIVGKLEEYINSKFNNFGKSIPEKLNQNVNCKSGVIDKKTFEAFENNINLKLDDLARNVTKKLEENINCSPDILKKVTDLHEMLNHKLEVLDKKIPVKLEENVSTRLEAVAKNISMKFGEEINCILNNKKAMDFEENEPDQSDEDENELPDKVINIPESIPHKTELACKEDLLSSNQRVVPYYSMDNETLNHVTVKRDSAGLLSHFEMHIAIQADYYVDIKLKDVNNTDICVIYVGLRSNQFTELWYQWRRVERVHTPDILSSTQFRTFYVKVDDGILEFGKEGSPLISHYDTRIRSAHYFLFDYNGYNTSKIRYDCPSVPGEWSISYTEITAVAVSFYFVLYLRVCMNDLLILHLPFSHTTCRPVSEVHACPCWHITALDGRRATTTYITSFWDQAQIASLRVPSYF